VQDIINDPYLYNIDRDLRNCVFPDEASGTAYSKYSFSTCVTDCLKRAQIRVCNCTHYNMIVDDNDKSPECDFYGLACLDNNDLLFPQMTIMQPWRVDGMTCTCLPSCNELQINVVGRSSRILNSTKLRSVSIKLQSLPSQRYFRQAVREKVDIVGE
jgi:acid-sensing ion channel, other